MNRHWVLCGALLVSLSGAAAAQERLYVTDELRLGVHRAEDTSDRAFAFVESGDSVEVMDRNRFFALVRLADGRRGWVRATYLVALEPARARLAAVEAERDELASQLEALRASVAEPLAKMESLERQLSESESQRQAEGRELADLRDSNAGLAQRLEAYRFSMPTSWVAWISLVCVVAGAALSWWWLDRRSRQRHGGFRIY
jgi:SH3 domain protein